MIVVAIKGVTHRRVDRKAGVADGTTSFYFRTSAALFQAVAQRIADLDLADLEAATNPGDGGAASGLAALVIRSASGQRLARSKARYELAMPATRDTDLAASFFQNQQRFVEIHREVVVRLLPEDTDASVIDERAFLLMMFISGLMIATVRGERAVESAEHLERLITSIVAQSANE